MTKKRWPVSSDVKKFLLRRSNLVWDGIRPRLNVVRIDSHTWIDCYIAVDTDGFISIFYRNKPKLDTESEDWEDRSNQYLVIGYSLGRKKFIEMWGEEIIPPKGDCWGVLLEA